MQMPDRSETEQAGRIAGKTLLIVAVVLVLLLLIGVCAYFSIFSSGGIIVPNGSGGVMFPPTATP